MRFLCEIFAVSSYCPITNLEHADSAYEWAFGELKGYEKMDFKILDATSFNVRKEQPKKESVSFNQSEIKAQNELKEQFKSYLKSINFNDENFKNELKSVILKLANDELKNGKNLDEFSWLIIKNGVASDLNWSEYVGYVGRIKGVPAFDSFTLSSGKNELFGDEKIRAKHFTKFSSEFLGSDKIADELTIKLLNPMNFIAKTPVKFWRIRHGVKDSDTTIAVPFILASRLKEQGKSVDFYAPWGQGHGGDYDLDELFNWIDEISK